MMFRVQSKLLQHRRERRKCDPPREERTMEEQQDYVKNNNECKTVRLMPSTNLSN